MNFFDNVKEFFNLDKRQPQKANALAQIAYQDQLQRVKQDATTYKLAIQSAESVRFPNRYLLTQLYQKIVLDGQVSSAFLQRKMKVLNANFEVMRGEVVDEEKTKLLRSQWFYDFVDYSLDSILHGYTLTQFGELKNDKFTSIDVVPREYVIPEKGILKTTTANIDEGINYEETPYNYWCIGVGRKKDLGLLMKLAPYVMFKANAFNAWAEYAEIFGTPLRVVKTDVRDEATRKNAENMMRNMGVAAWSVLDTNDQYEILETSRTDSYNIYDKLIERADQQISKIILGQTGTTDEKSYSGSADVHADIAGGIAQQDLRFIEMVVNNQLFPMMMKLGFDLSGLEFFFNQSESISIIDQAKIDSSFMPYVKYDKKFLEQKYGIVLSDEEVEDNSFENKLKTLYK